MNTLPPSRAGRGPGWTSALWTLLLLGCTGLALTLWLQEVQGIPLDESSLELERPWALLLLLAAPLVFVARVTLDRRRAPLIKLSRASLLAQLPTGRRVRLRPLVAALRIVAVCWLAVGLAGPRSIHARDHAQLEGIDIVLALDLSLSMQAGDIEPNRFEATKYVVGDFVRRRPNDRIAAVVFGREAYTLLPLTTDREALHHLVDELQLGVIEGRGTAIGNAVGVSLNRLRRSMAKSKVIILLTDGDSNSGNLSPQQGAELAEHMQVKLYTILMGRSEQASAPSGLDLFGRTLFSKGSFPINPKLLEEMAGRTGGQAFVVSDRGELERSFHSILDTLEKSQIEDAGRVYSPLFSGFVGAAVVLLLLEALLGTLILRRWP